LREIEAEKRKWTDDLTGLRNKNAYNEEVPQLLSIEKRESNDCSLLVIDFDYFKRVNDEYGHDVGDLVLKKMAEILKEAVRSSDVVYRFGGEEFVIFLPATIASRAVDVAEKIRAKMEKSKILTTDVNGKKITLKDRTISIGCVGTDQLKEWDDYNFTKDKDKDKEFLNRMFKAADLSVNTSKEEGRNRVTLYGEART
jgi:diguanylate cyclase (GGDEF)-like protein